MSYLLRYLVNYLPLVREVLGDDRGRGGFLLLRSLGRWTRVWLDDRNIADLDDVSKRPSQIGREGKVRKGKGREKYLLGCDGQAWLRWVKRLKDWEWLVMANTVESR